MGTNYYLETDVCPTCSCSKGRLHIGKSSAGWCFALHVDPDLGIEDLADWEERFASPNSRIVDDGGNQLTPEQMLYRITDCGRLDAPPEGFSYVANQAMPGPRNLIRRCVDGHCCIGHGAGTYDLIAGEFE